jgi:ribonuclease E
MEGADGTTTPRAEGEQRRSRRGGRRRRRGGQRENAMATPGAEGAPNEAMSGNGFHVDANVEDTHREFTAAPDHAASDELIRPAPQPAWNGNPPPVASDAVQAPLAFEQGHEQPAQAAEPVQSWQSFHNTTEEPAPDNAAPRDEWKPEAAPGFESAPAPVPASDAASIDDTASAIDDAIPTPAPAPTPAPQEPSRPAVVWSSAAVSRSDSPFRDRDE